MLPGLCLMDFFVRHRSRRDGPDADTRDRGLFSGMVRQRIVRTSSDRV